MTVSTILFPILFADDTNVCINGKDIGVLMVNMNRENPIYCIYFKKRNENKLHDVQINGISVSKVGVTKFLGRPYIDSKLSYRSSHLKYLKLPFMMRIFNFVNFESLIYIKLYNLLILNKK